MYDAFQLYLLSFTEKNTSCLKFTDFQDEKKKFANFWRVEYSVNVKKLSNRLQGFERMFFNRFQLKLNRNTLLSTEMTLRIFNEFLEF